MLQKSSQILWGLAHAPYTWVPRIFGITHRRIWSFPWQDFGSTKKLARYLTIVARKRSLHKLYYAWQKVPLPPSLHQNTTSRTSIPLVTAASGCMPKRTDTALMTCREPNDKAANHFARAMLGCWDACSIVSGTRIVVTGIGSYGSVCLIAV